MSEFHCVSAWEEEQDLRRLNLLSRGACRPPGMSEVPGLAPRPEKAPKGQSWRQASGPGRESEDRERTPHPPCPQAGAPQGGLVWTCSSLSRRESKEGLDKPARGKGCSCWRAGPLGRVPDRGQPPSAYGRHTEGRSLSNVLTQAQLSGWEDLLSSWLHPFVRYSRPPRPACTGRGRGSGRTNWFCQTLMLALSAQQDSLVGSVPRILGGLLGALPRAFPKSWWAAGSFQDPPGLPLEVSGYL